MFIFFVLGANGRRLEALLFLKPSWFKFSTKIAKGSENSYWQFQALPLSRII